MIILVQPMYSKQELNADSNYVVYTALIRAMATVRPDWHWIVVFPDDKSGFKYENDGFFQSRNVTRVPQRISTRKMTNAMSYDGRWYDEFLKNFGVDAVWCNLVEIAGHIRHAGEGTYEMKAKPYVVAAHNYVIHDSLPYRFDGIEHVALAQVAGAALADHNVFNSDYCQRMFLETAEKWLSERAIASIVAKSSRIDYGTLEESIQPRPRSNAVPLIAYNHRLQAYKNYKETFALLAELYEEGVPFRVRYMNNTAEQTSLIVGYPFVEVRLSATRAEYLQALSECDLNVINSQHETFCIAAVESMAYGQPLVAPDGITFPEITGRQETHYPYLFKSREEQKAMLRRLLTDAAEREAWGQKLSKYVREHYNAQVWAVRYAELFERLRPAENDTAEDAMAHVAAALEQHNGVTVRELYRVVQGKQVNGRIPFGSQSLSMLKLAQLVRQLGGRVVMEQGLQRVYKG